MAHLSMHPVEPAPCPQLNMLNILNCSLDGFPTRLEANADPNLSMGVEDQGGGTQEVLQYCTLQKLEAALYHPVSRLCQGCPSYWINWGWG